MKAFALHLRSVILPSLRVSPSFKHSFAASLASAPSTSLISLNVLINCLIPNLSFGSFVLFINNSHSLTVIISFIFVFMNRNYVKLTEREMKLTELNEGEWWRGERHSEWSENK